MITATKTYGVSKSYHQPQPAPNSAPSPDESRPAAIMPVDRVTLSKHALERPNLGNSGNPAAADQELTTEEQAVVTDLKQRDTEVKAHEQAHMAAGSGVTTSGATYQYETGPDGKMYAVGGEVKIDLSSEGSPEATVRKMQQVQAAALAPAQPSGTDRSVAAQASQIEAMARLEKAEKAKETEPEEGGRSPKTDGPASSPHLFEQTGGTIDLMA